MAGSETGSGFVRLKVADIELGKPLPYPLYDSMRKVLVQRGQIVHTLRQCEQLIDRGLYRNLSERTLGPPSTVAAEAPQSRESLTTLDAARIRVGDTLFMQSGAESPRLAVKLIGYLKGRGLITTEPEDHGDVVMLKDGQTFVVRFFSGQNAYAFTTTVARHTTVPYPHVHLAYPREVRGLEIRKGSRIDVELIAAIQMDVDGETRSGSGKFVNMSTGGGALRAKAALGNKGDTISVKFKIEIGDIQSYLVFDAIIRMVSKDDGDLTMPWMHGLQFINPDQNMTLALSAFVYQRLVDDAR